MEFDLDTGWQLLPAGGDTGRAYIGIRAEEKVFLKRNSSPFLAALSLEGVTPRLVWTKRMGNGDVLTAQEWLNGRVLAKEEMDSPQVAKLLRKIHTSAPLKKMLKRVGGVKTTPADFLELFKMDLDDELRVHPLIQKVQQKLAADSKNLPNVSVSVCHGDIYRKNWLLSDENKLYLVDWDMALLADPFIDLSMLLFQYVAREKWTEWLLEYGEPLTPDLLNRIRWYGMINLLNRIKQYHQKGHFHEMNHSLIALEKVFNRTEQSPNL